MARAARRHVPAAAREAAATRRLTPEARALLAGQAARSTVAELRAGVTRIEQLKRKFAAQPHEVKYLSDILEVTYNELERR